MIQKSPGECALAEMVLKPTPEFGKQKTFFVQSPVLVKRTIDRDIKFYFPKDDESDEFMTETMNRKLDKVGKGHLDVKVSFDRQYRSPEIKLTKYKGINMKGTLCPVIVEGDPEAVAFAWDVGVGNGTGIGFGALK